MRSFAAGAVLALLSAASLSAQDAARHREMLATATLWQPTDVPSMNLREGSGGPGAFGPGETVRCDYLDRDLHGNSPKFRCRIPPDDDIKVKFGDDNGEVFAEVVSTRLLWALGFGADRMYPVRLICRGCPVAIGEPGEHGARIIELATVERRFDPQPAAPATGGWSFAELDLLDERVGGEPRAHRDALKLLAVLIQHTDTKSEQQRLICLEALPGSAGRCDHPFLMLNDVGLTFGRATLLNSNAVSGMNYREWAGTPVWKYANTCIGNLSKSLTGTLRDPLISEEGRQFLATRLNQLSDAQLHDLFDVARVERRAEPEGTRGARATVEQWVSAFKQKRASIAERRCADDWSTRAPALFTTSPNLWLQSWASTRLTTVMDVISLCGYNWFYVAIAMLLAFAVNVRAGASLLVLLVLTNVITGATKTVVSYPRPDAVDHRVAALGVAARVADTGNTNIVPLVPAAAQRTIAKTLALPQAVDADDAYGFPSGHVSVAMAFFCGLVFLFGWRGAWLGALIWVPLMGLSRMYLGRHFLGDVIGGVAAGVVATMVVVRALNLQRLGGTGDRRVLIKTAATAAACVLLALVTAIPSTYEAGRLTGAVVALLLVSGAPAGYDDASPVVRMARLVLAVGCSGAVWWASQTALHANAGEPGLTQLFLTGGVRTFALLPLPMIVEEALRRMSRPRSRSRTAIE